MPKKVRTAKGKELDFDLLRIKQQMADQQEPAEVRQRQDFIDQKMRRRVKKVKDQLASAKKNKGVEVDPDLDVKSSKQAQKIDEVKPPKRKIKRKQVKK